MDDHTHDTFDVRDIDVAARLDSTPIKVRKLIHKHLDELIKF